MSTGMGQLEEIEEAIEAIYKTGNKQLAIMKCSSAYPAKIEEMNLATIADMKQKFQIPVGLSDHSMGYLSAEVGTALGANIIEKHFCISREIENPDSSFSMTPEEFKAMVNAVRTVEKAKGIVQYGVEKQEETNIKFRRSLFVVEDIKAGEIFTEKNVRSIRPGYGMKPKFLPDVLGKSAAVDIKRGEPLKEEMINR